jgi:hypothetical protein
MMIMLNTVVHGLLFLLDHLTVVETKEVDHHLVYLVLPLEWVH